MIYSPPTQSILEKAAKIKLVIFDVDGVLTDRKIYLSDTGEEQKAFNTHDGLGMKLLLKTGVEIGIISARSSVPVTKRMSELGVKHVFQGRPNKVETLEELLQQLNMSLEQVAYVGDDLPDLPVMRRVGLGIAVADAIPFVREHADWQTKAIGGEGAAREVCDLMMQAQETWHSQYEHYLL